MDAVLSDLEHFVGILRNLDHHTQPEARKFFDLSVPVTIARAPGRLDVMGGIADYSGSLVLQRPIKQATFAAVQPSDQPAINVVSLTQPTGPARVYRIKISSLTGDEGPIPYPEAEAFFKRVPDDHWAAYAAGVFLVLMRERGIRFSRGAKVLIFSAVPEGKGVASSAALDVAVMMGVCTAFGISLEMRDVALLCQKVENLVAGAACGVMDQMTSVFGEADCLLAMLCQPAELQPPVHVPPDLAFWGVDSGERHAVGGASYESVRAGTFMGYRIIAGSDDRSHGYLGNISPTDFERDLLSLLPEEMSGVEFLRRYGSTSDTVTRVDPSRTYKIRKPTAHPVYEHDRVRRFRDLLLDASSEERWTSLGQLMYQSHASYGACGLGSPGTDMIVGFVRDEGPAAGLYGARITGGGSGGTVAIMGRREAEPAVARVVERYRTATGYDPFTFSGSSNGAASFGSLTLNL
jgi:galactokinase